MKHHFEIEIKPTQHLSSVFKNFCQNNWLIKYKSSQAWADLEEGGGRPPPQRFDPLPTQRVPLYTILKYIHFLFLGDGPQKFSKGANLY